MANLGIAAPFYTREIGRERERDRGVSGEVLLNCPNQHVFSSCLFLACRFVDFFF